MQDSSSRRAAASCQVLGPEQHIQRSRAKGNSSTVMSHLLSRKLCCSLCSHSSVHKTISFQLQSVSGGAWAGSVYDVDRILAVLEAGRKALETAAPDEA